MHRALRGWMDPELGLCSSAHQENDVLLAVALGKHIRAEAIAGDGENTLVHNVPRPSVITSSCCEGSTVSLRKRPCFFAWAILYPYQHDRAPLPVYSTFFGCPLRRGKVR